MAWSGRVVDATHQIPSLWNPIRLISKHWRGYIIHTIEAWKPLMHMNVNVCCRIWSCNIRDKTYWESSTISFRALSSKFWAAAHISIASLKAHRAASAGPPHSFADGVSSITHRFPLNLHLFSSTRTSFFTSHRHIPTAPTPHDDIIIPFSHPVP